MTTDATPLALVTVLCLASAFGCATGPEIRRTANDATREINALSESLTAVAPILDAVCAEGDHSPACDLARGLWQSARLAIDTAHGAVDLYDRTGAGLSAVNSTIDRATEVARKAREAIEALR